MPKSLVTVVALVALVGAGAVAYYLNREIGAATPGAAQIKAAAGKSPDKAAKGPPGGAAAPVEVVVLHPTRVSEELQAVGSLRSNESVMLRPEVSGRIATIAFRDGQPVKRGQLLIALDSALNEAEVAQARAELDLAMSNLKRTEELASANFVSASAQEQAAANVAVLAARLKLAEARLAKMSILAPFDGVAGIRSVSPGDYVREGADLVNIEDIRTLKADFACRSATSRSSRSDKPSRSSPTRCRARAMPA